MIRLLTLTVLFLIATQSVAQIGARERARIIHDRITGVPASEADLDQMQGMTPINAAIYAMEQGENSRFFATVTLKNLAAPWTNRDQTAFVPLNDYTTLVIGTVVHDLPFNEILTANRLVVQRDAPRPTASSNAHYVALEAAMQDPDFDPVTDLEVITQSEVYTMLPAQATAGVMTTRAASEAFFVAGTNRAMLRFTLMNHMCMDLEQLHDTSIVPDRIRQDVSRSPGADSRVFLNNCIGCHAGMDPLAQAYAYYNFNEDSGTIEYTPGSVQPKYFNGEDTFADGFVTPDDHWSNYWREGQNSLVGWAPGPGEGNGAQSLGAELAGTRAFAECQVKKVFQSVCLREPTDGDDRNQIETIATMFQGGYDLKQVFARSVAYCTEDL